MPTREKLKKFAPYRVSNDHKPKYKKMNYKKYLTTNYWKSLKESVIHRDQKCMCCGLHENLEVHHLLYRGRGNELLDDLTCLCSSCHSKVHKYFPIRHWSVKHTRNKKPLKKLSSYETKRYNKNMEIMRRRYEWSYNHMK